MRVFAPNHCVIVSPTSRRLRHEKCIPFFKSFCQPFFMGNTQHVNSIFFHLPLEIAHPVFDMEFIRII